MWNLALRSLLRHKVRTGFSLAAIVCGVAAMILSGGFVADIYIQLGEALIHSQSGHLQVLRAGFFEAGSRSPEKYTIEDRSVIADQLRDWPEVAQLMGRVSFSGLLSNGRTDLPIVGEGVEPGPEARLGTSLRIVSGARLDDAKPHQVLIGGGVASALELVPGDRVILVVSSAEGALNSLDLEVAGVFQSFSRDFDARAVRIPLAAAQELLGSQGVNALVLELHKTEDTARVGSMLVASLDSARFEVKTWQQLNDFYEKVVALYERQFGVLRLVILVMVLLSVGNTVNLGTWERTGEFGTMMALGNRPGQVFRLVIAENLLLGTVGALLGTAFGVLLALAVSAVGIPMPPPPDANIGYMAYIRIVPRELAISAAIGIAATVGGSLFPAVRASRIPVVDALRHNA